MSPYFHASCLSLFLWQRGDAVQLRGPSSPVEQFGDVLANTPVSVSDEQIQALHTSAGLTSELRALGREHSSATKIDPFVTTASSCDRDYTAACPLGFDSQGGQCVASEEYNGPCSNSHTLASLSVSAKRRWSKKCVAFWPCVDCARDYSSACPAGWQHGEGATCSAPSSYAGPCKSSADFYGYSSTMLDDWSAKCGAYWSCA